MSKKTPVMSGGCQCGALRYALYVAPTGGGICHCTMCQKATGGSFAAFTGVPNEEFAWTKGEPATYRSSDVGARDFCRDCGTPMGFRGVSGTRTTINIGTLDEPNKVAVERQIGTEGKLSWVDDIAGLPGKTTIDDCGADYVAKVEASRAKAR